MSKNIFKKKPKYHFFFGNESVGGFNVDFYMNENKIEDCYVHIHGKSIANGIFDVKFNGYSYGYLMESARQGITDNIEGFCTMLYAIVNQVYADEGLYNDLIKAIQKYQKRLLKRAEKEAANISEVQNEADTAFMQSVVEFAEADPKRRKEIQAEDKALLKEMLNGKEE